MSCYKANLLTRIKAISAELAEMTPAKMGGMANTKTQDGGTTVDHVGYRKSLLEELKALREELALANEVEAAEDGNDGPFEITTITDT